MYKVIMAPTEGSDSEKVAISVAVKLAQSFEADLRLVRVNSEPLVVESIAQTPVLPTEQMLWEERVARLRKLEALGSECRALGEIRIMTALEDGPVGPTLRDYALKFNVDLIVMSSHARGGMKRITLGSVTDYLIRRTNIPVLVVRPPISFIAAR
ncbi:MAG TPA: universal stress protein, partial [Gemmatimonadaceae bacterium]